ncbi:hypothetical protein [Rhizobium bangladeshense]|uniref:hypothetical protein n=1 Tax=Rhizobium bangladeshense TaxID=1138189 RepID=UPI0012E755A1|nr:hypothetical protein [Rhizobium bangladeshense]
MPFADKADGICRCRFKHGQRKSGMSDFGSAQGPLQKRRIRKIVELTPNLAGTFIAICHSTDYQTPRVSNGLDACESVRQSL